MHRIFAIYKGKQTEAYAPTGLAASETAAKFFKARKPWEVTVFLAEKKGQPVVHTADF